ncbi:MAG: iron-sulfur cluster assembly accessory protein [Parvibaculaceae bacterium]|nr:iron-sulfur cluster assembly accessory protein [Parvibaculaceae bacterium]
MATAAPKRQRPKAMSLTQAAADKVSQIMSGSDQDIIGVRVGVETGGCAGMTYSLEYAKEKNPLDEVVVDKGVTVLIDPKAVLFLLGTEMDYEVDRFTSGFKFNNPNAVDACGCGESFTINQASGEALAEFENPTSEKSGH